MHSAQPPHSGQSGGLLQTAKTLQRTSRCRSANHAFNHAPLAASAIDEQKLQTDWFGQDTRQHRQNLWHQTTLRRCTSSCAFVRMVRFLGKLRLMEAR
jgi:hypothetical protein